MKQALSFVFIAALGVFTLMQCAESGAPAAESAATPQPTREDTIKRGEYLVTLMGCHDCHSPKRMGPNGPEDIPGRQFSGHDASIPFEMPNTESVKDGWALIHPAFTAFVGPWGVSFTANLTSDQSGIGNWTLDHFKRALKEGKLKGLESGRPLLPPMPWFNFGNISDADIAAMFTYLKSTKPVSNVVPPPIPPDQLPKG